MGRKAVVRLLASKPHGMSEVAPPPAIVAPSMQEPAPVDWHDTTGLAQTHMADVDAGANR